MKKIFILVLFLSAFIKCISQNIGINATGATPHSSAMLDVSSTDKGMLVPRMTSAQRIAITSPAKGLLVFDNDLSSFYFYTGTAWTQLAGGTGNYWSANGNDIYNNNSGNVGVGTITPSEKFTLKSIGYGITHTDGTVKLSTYLGSDASGSPTGGWLGTSTNHPLYFYANGGIPKMSILQNGNVGIGTTSPATKLNVQTLTNSYGVTQTDGTVTVGTYIGASEGWLGTLSNHPLTFFTNNGLQAMTLGTNGYFGIGNNAPANRLEIGSAPYAGYDFAIGDKYNAYNGMAFLIGGNATKWATTGDIFINAGSVTGTPHIGIGVTSATNKFQIGSMGLTGYSGNDLAIGNGTNATGFFQSNSSLQVASSTNIVFLPGPGRVGINTSTPRYPLEVAGSVTSGNKLYAYFALDPNNNGGVDIEGAAINPADISIYASNRVFAEEFNAFSDARIKNIIGTSNTSKDLQTINALQITDYTMKDKIKYGNDFFKKVIAQDVEKVYPQIVSKHTDFIPNVYLITSKIEKADGGYLLQFSEKHNISKSAKKLQVLLTEEKGMQQFDIVSIPNDKQVVINATDLKTDKLFVYGEQVDDFRTVDYEGLTTLNISATQELSKLISEQNKKIEAMESEIVLLRKKKD